MLTLALRHAGLAAQEAAPRKGGITIPIPTHPIPSRPPHSFHPMCPLALGLVPCVFRTPRIKFVSGVEPDDHKKLL